MSTGSNLTAKKKPVQEIGEIDARALSENMIVLGEVGRAQGAEGLYLVIGQSGEEYLVDARGGVCECPDHRYRERYGKHLRRVDFATGERVIPAWVDRSEIDDLLGVAVAGPVFAPEHPPESESDATSANPEAMSG